jgi:hypothetical protein
MIDVSARAGCRSVAWSRLRRARRKRNRSAAPAAMDVRAQAPDDVTREIFRFAPGVRLALTTEALDARTGSRRVPDRRWRDGPRSCHWSRTWRSTGDKRRSRPSLPGLRVFNNWETGELVDATARVVETVRFDELSQGARPSSCGPAERRRRDRGAAGRSDLRCMASSTRSATAIPIHPLLVVSQPHWVARLIHRHSVDILVTSS